jgi:hypothetical protein
LSADQGNRHGIINLDFFTDELKERGSGVLESANTVTDAALAKAQRWANIRDLRSRINTLEADANHQDTLADDLEHTGKGSSGGVTKVINALGSVGAVKFRVEAAKYRAEAARLREELAGVENQNQFSADDSAP